MNIFFDFDDVLFYTNPFIEGKQEIFSRYGVPENIYKETYEQSKSGTEKTKVYDIDMHLQILKDIFPDIDEAGIQKGMDTLSEQSGKFVFSDVIDILEWLKSRNHWLAIVSFGNSEFQKKKIQHSGLVPYFDAIIADKEQKSDMIQSFSSKMSDAETWFIDDSPRFLEDIKQTYPQIRTIQVTRKEARWKHDRCGSADFCASDMGEVRKILEGKI